MRILRTVFGLGGFLFAVVAQLFLLAVPLRILGWVCHWLGSIVFQMLRLAWYVGCRVGACYLGYLHFQHHGELTPALWLVAGSFALTRLLGIPGLRRVTGRVRLVQRGERYRDLWETGMLVVGCWLGHRVFATFGTWHAAIPLVLLFVIAASVAGPFYFYRNAARKHLSLRKVWNPDEERTEWKLGWFPDRELFVFRRFVAALVCVATVLATQALAPVQQRFADRYAKEMDVLVSGKYSPSMSTYVLSRDGKWLCTYMIAVPDEVGLRLRSAKKKQDRLAEDREVIPIEKINTTLLQAFISAEDRNFWTHRGLDLIAVGRALRENVRELYKEIQQLLAGAKPKKAKRQGGSTISQQVLKQLVIKTSEQTFERKIAELFLAPLLERRMTKRMILEVYVNHIFLGNRAHGVEAAARRYFGKTAADMTLGEMALVAGLAKAPSYDSPMSSPDRARKRRAYVLERMHADKAINEKQLREAMTEPVTTVSEGINRNVLLAPHFCDQVKREAVRLVGEQIFNHGGLRIVTTLDPVMQRAAMNTVEIGLLELERRLGFSGPVSFDPKFKGECDGPTEIPDATIVPGRVARIGDGAITVCAGGIRLPLDQLDVENIVAWQVRTGKRLAVGDAFPVRIETRTREVKFRPAGQPRAPLITQKVSERFALTAIRNGDPKRERLQATIISIDPKVGAVRSLVGGYRFENQYNCADPTSDKFGKINGRQPGSTIKAFVFANALRHGAQLTLKLVDKPRTYFLESGPYRVHNYVGGGLVYRGEVNLTTAFKHSLNSIAVELCWMYGLDNCIQTMYDAGITSRIPRVLSVSLGAGGLTPMELTYAYSTIVANGKRMPKHAGTEKPGYYISQISDRRGKPLYSQPEVNVANFGQAIPAGVAYAVIHMMKAAITDGTGRAIATLLEYLVLAGKTGTTSDFVDAWFCVASPDLVTCVWVGRENNKRRDPIAEEKASGGAIALPFARAYLEQIKHLLPKRDFPMPDDGVMLSVDEEGKTYPEVILPGRNR